MERTFITYKDSVYDAIEIEAYKIDKEVTDENVIYTLFVILNFGLLLKKTIWTVSKKPLI